MTPHDVRGCLEDVAHRIMMDAVYTDEPITRYVQDWMGHGHLGDGYTAEEMVEAIRTLYLEQRRFDQLMRGF